ncbi:MAG: phytanoyl-CoA dioxygenase family protein (plasmid) [Arsenophonus sp.]|nr:MAG: phytanoyl-CoA dioxygenase family protein [Arsenophonus sp.]
MMESKRKTFEKTGIIVLNQIIPKELIFFINKKITFSIESYSNELNYDVKDYLKVVSRWAFPCEMIKNFLNSIELQLINIASEFIGMSVRLHKINIISKSAYSDLPIPCHQDIAYSPNDPYEFSLWLALQDVNIYDGVLEFLPCSQNDKIEPAIDFWSPDFIDRKQQSNEWKKYSIQVPVKAGDIIIFDSKIWHRSDKNRSGKYRFALVTRWSRINYKLSFDIPKKIPAYFGMWTCSKITQSLLKKGLEKLFNKTVTNDLNQIINLWQETLISRKKIPFDLNINQAQKSLKDILILNYAAIHHNGGDAQGIVYSYLWNNLLKPISKWLNT